MLKLAFKYYNFVHVIRILSALSLQEPPNRMQPLFLLEELVCQNLSNREIVGPFGIGCVMQNNMEFAQIDSTTKGTHVEHDVTTYGVISGL